MIKLSINGSTFNQKKGGYTFQPRKPMFICGQKRGLGEFDLT